jgi:NNP family nitrate/nitrite transporter-like MFS transporter
MNHPKEDSFLSQMGSLLPLVGIFLTNFLSRIILSPLMPTVEEDLKIGHDEAGSFFFLITLGYCTGLFLSGFFSSRFKHRRTIIFAAFAVGGTLFLISAIRDLWAIRLGLVVMGLAAGFYLPSGISTLTSLVSQRHWGKAIALHEMAPNVGFIAAPVLAEVLLGWCSWQGILIVVGVASCMVGLIFALLGKGGDFYGAAPDLKNLKNILKEPSFLLMVVFFSLGVGASFSIYSMIPLYLVSEKGMDRTWANTLLALSRIAPVATAFVAGWMTDRLGAKKTLKVVFLSAGLTTVMIGIAPVPWIIPVIFLQPILSTAFFPAGFAALAKVVDPHIKNLAVSLTVPVGFLVGVGIGAAGLGLAGEAKLFYLGFIIFGGFICGGAGLVRYLKLADDKR